MWYVRPAKAQAGTSLHLSKCHIVGNLMSRLNLACLRADCGAASLRFFCQYPQLVFWLRIGKCGYQTFCLTWTDVVIFIEMIL